jgi:hypothetical protein
MLQIASNSWMLGMLSNDVTSIAEFISHQITQDDDYERRSEEYGKRTVVTYFTAVEGLTLHITATCYLDRFTL